MVGDLADMLPSFLRMVGAPAVELGRRMHQGLEPIAGARHPQPALLRLSVSAISDPTHFSVGAGCGAGNDNREGRKFCGQRGQLLKLACPYCGAPKLISLEECRTLMRGVLEAYASYYNEVRTHLSLDATMKEYEL
jgi:hypothetical protein